MLGCGCICETNQTNKFMVPELNPTSHAKFPALVDAGQAPGPNIVASISIICLSESSGLAMVGDRHLQLQTLPCGVICC